MEIKHEKILGKIYTIINKKESHLMYSLQDRVMDCYHTYVPLDLNGQGIASKMAEKAFEYAKENNFKIKGTCSFVAAYMKKNKELYGDYYNIY